MISPSSGRSSQFANRRLFGCAPEMGGEENGASCTLGGSCDERRLRRPKLRANEKSRSLASLRVVNHARSPAARAFVRRLQSSGLVRRHAHSQGVA